MGNTHIEEFLTIEEFIEGDFIKYINNTGNLCGEESDLRKKAESQALFSYDKSIGRLTLIDLQGADYSLYDPEIGSREHLDEKGNVWFLLETYQKRLWTTFFRSISIPSTVLF